MVSPSRSVGHGHLDRLPTDCALGSPFNGQAPHQTVEVGLETIAQVPATSGYTGYVVGSVPDGGLPGDYTPVGQDWPELAITWPS